MARENAHVDPANPGDTIWRTFDHRPRFGNNYVGLRNRVAILSEAYSYLDFRGRVRVTEVFVEELLHAVVANASRITILTTQLDAETKSLATAPVPRAKGPVAGAARNAFGVEFKLSALPAPVDILVGDVTKQPNPASGRDMLVMSDTVTPVRMKDYGTFEALRGVQMPRGWLIPRPHVESGRYAAAIDRLRWHGLQVQRVASDAQVDVERFVVQSLTKGERAFQGHNEARALRPSGAGEADGEGGFALHPRRPAARAPRLLPPRGGERRRPGDVEPDRSGVVSGRDVSGVSRDESRRP